MVEADQVKQAKEKYLDVLIAIEQTEKEAAARLEQDVQRQQQDELLKSLHLDHVDMLFDNMFREDMDLKKYRPLADQAIHDLHDEYRVKYEIVINDLRHFIAKQKEARADELKVYQKSVDEVKMDVDRECIDKIHGFHQYKKQMLRQFQNAEPTELEQGLKELRLRVRQLSNYLMAQEMTLVEQFEDVVKEIEQNYTGLCQTAVETARQSFSRMRELENECHEKVNEAVVAAFEKFAKADIDELDEVLRDLVVDKDTIVNMLTSSHDQHISKIDQQVSYTNH